MLSKQMLFKHSSLLVMLMAAFCTFFTNIVAKKYLDPEQYAQLALYLIYVGYLGTLSFLASDNVLIRYSEYKDKQLHLPKNVLIVAGVSWIFAFALIPLLASKIFELVSINIVLYYLPVLFISLSIILSLIARLTEHFLSSQLFLHSWKVIFFCAILYFALYPKQTLGNDYSLWGVSGSLLLSSVIGLMYLLFSKHITLQTSNKNISFGSTLKMQYSYVLSLIYFAVLGSADRVILSMVMEPAAMADYLYFVSMLLFPIGIITNYVGFKELVFIKNGKNINIKETIKKTTTLAVSLYFVYSFLIYNLQVWIDLKFDFIVWLGILGIVFCKIPYAIYSALLGAKSVPEDVMQINHISFVILIITCGIIYFSESYYIAIYSISLAWFTRVWLFRHKSRKYV